MQDDLFVQAYAYAREKLRYAPRYACAFAYGAAAGQLPETVNDIEVMRGFRKGKRFRLPARDQDIDAAPWREELARETGEESAPLPLHAIVANVLELEAAS